MRELLIQLYNSKDVITDQQILDLIIAKHRIGLVVLGGMGLTVVGGSIAIVLASTLNKAKEQGKKIEEFIDKLMAELKDLVIPVYVYDELIVSPKVFDYGEFYSNAETFIIGDNIKINDERIFQLNPIDVSIQGYTTIKEVVSFYEDQPDILSMFAEAYDADLSNYENILMLNNMSVHFQAELKLNLDSNLDWSEKGQHGELKADKLNKDFGIVYVAIKEHIPSTIASEVRDMIRQMVYDNHSVELTTKRIANRFK